MTYDALFAVVTALLVIGVPAALAAGQLIAQRVSRTRSRRLERSAGAVLAGTLAFCWLLAGPALVLQIGRQDSPIVRPDDRTEAVVIALLIGGTICAIVCLLLAIGLGIAAWRATSASYGPKPRPVPVRLAAACGPAVAMIAVVGLVAAFAPAHPKRVTAFSPVATPPAYRTPATAPTPPGPEPPTASPTPRFELADGRQASDQLMAKLLAGRGPADPPNAEQLGNSAQRTGDATRSEPCPGGAQLTRTVVFTGDDVVGAVTRVLDVLGTSGFEFVGTVGADLYLPPASSPLERVTAGSRNDNAGFITITTRCLRA